MQVRYRRTIPRGHPTGFVAANHHLDTSDATGARESKPPFHAPPPWSWLEDLVHDWTVENPDPSRVTPILVRHSQLGVHSPPRGSSAQSCRSRARGASDELLCDLARPTCGLAWLELTHSEVRRRDQERVSAETEQRTREEEIASASFPPDVDVGRPRRSVQSEVEGTSWVLSRASEGLEKDKIQEVEAVA
eukprot:IDg3138t1